MGGFGTSNQLAGQGVFLPNARGRSTDTVPDDAINYNLYVNSAGQFRFKNIPISDRDFTNYMLGNLISGQGPENYVFPENGFVSERAAKGETFKKAIDQWYTDNEIAITKRRNKNLKPGDFKVGYGPIEQLNDLSRDGTPITIPNFIASAWASIDLLGGDTIRITIFNISSLTSGDGAKHLLWNKYPRAVKRIPGQITPFGSISTTFSVTRRIDYRYFQTKWANEVATEAGLK